MVTELGAAAVALHQDIRLTHIAQPLRAVGVVALRLSRKILLAEAADSEVASAAAKRDVTLKAPFAPVRLGEAVGETADRALQGWSLVLTNTVLGARGAICVRRAGLPCARYRHLRHLILQLIDLTRRRGIVHDQVDHRMVVAVGRHLQR